MVVLDTAATLQIDSNARMEPLTPVEGIFEKLDATTPKRKNRVELEKQPKNTAKTQKFHLNRTESSQARIRDLYKEDYERSPALYYYYRYVNPWIRFLLLIPILYIYAVCSAILTYRNNTFTDKLKAIGTVEGTYPLQIVDGLKPFILPDLLFEIIPPAHKDHFVYWTWFADFTPLFLTGLMCVLMIARRDIIRITEYIGLQMVLFTANAICHVVTSVPDSGGSNAACLNPAYREWGSWIYSTFDVLYCGDMVFSGHTSNSLLPLIMIRRILADWMGWEFWFNLGSKPSESYETGKQYTYNNLLRKPRGESNTCEAFSSLNPAASIYLTEHDHPAHLFQYIKHATNRALILTDLHTDYLQQLQRKKENPMVAPMDSQNLEQLQTVPNVHMLRNRAKHLRRSISEYTSHANQSYYKEKDPSALIPPDANRATKEEPTVNSNNRTMDWLESSHKLFSSDEDCSEMQSNSDSDLLFVPRHSPFLSPPWVIKRQQFFKRLLTATRIILPIWFTVLLYSLVGIRTHYTLDLMVAILVVLLASSNAQLCQWLVRVLFRPNYHNYRYKEWYKPVYLTWPLNQEQINYEERVRRAGMSGML